MFDLIAVMLIVIFVTSVESLLLELNEGLELLSNPWGITGEGIMWSKPVLMVSAKSTSLASQLGTSTTTDQSMEDRKQPSSDL